MAHYLITGGAGFIGSHLAEALLGLEHRVTVIDNLSTGRFENIAPLTDHSQFHFAIDTITNEVVMDRLVSECDVVLHLAAAVGVELIIKDPVNVIETNILGTHSVLKVANRYRKKVLVASTSEIYGKSDQIPFREDDDRVLGTTTVARWSYSSSKAVDEFLALAYYRQKYLPVVIFRLFNTVGPRQTGRYGMVVPRFVRQALAGDSLTVYGDGSQARCFLHVKDAVRAIVALAGCPEAVGEVFNVGATEEITILGLAQRVLALVDNVQGKADGRIRLVPYEEAYEAGFEDMRRRVPDTSKIRQYVGWEPERSLDEILTDVIGYSLAAA
ncbi:MAG: GDP-mannose 4,6-dehydratase [Anaerolineae bacterium]|nr:GDP-mannose 4,6-dehydratase [Anaerolineae bacterium]